MCRKRSQYYIKRSYNTVILKLFRTNIDLQFVTGVYAMLTYLRSYFCKPEHAASEVMKKSSKEAYGKDIKGKMLSTGNTFLTERKVSTHKIFTYETFNYRCPVCSFQSKKE